MAAPFIARPTGRSESLAFRLNPEEAREVFALAAKLANFTRPVESGLKVANMGRKTFRFEDGATVHEVSFNYSIDADAKQLLGSVRTNHETEQRYLDLDLAVHFDKLGVDQAIIQIRMLWDAGTAGVAGAVSAVAGAHREERIVHARGSRARGQPVRGDSAAGNPR